ncbi:hypothetical protein ACUH94_00800 [Dermabacteraceae bacterium P7074]
MFIALNGSQRANQTEKMLLSLCGCLADTSRLDELWVRLSAAD